MGAIAESTFGNKPWGGSYKKRHYHKPWFDIDYRTMKCELRLWLKANPDSHVAKHQESKLKNLLKRNKIFSKTIRAQHMCAFAKVDALLFWKKYWPRALVMDKISVATLLVSFHWLVDKSPPLVRLRADHSA
jgi:hypothetical protein